MKSVMCKKVCVFGGGGFLLLLGAICGGLWGIIYDKMLKMELILSNTSKSYQIWKDIPIPIYMEFYMFNCSNAADIVAGRANTSHFVELGPYVFREYHHRVNITWNANETVTYRQVRSWHFIPEMSSGKLSDNVTNLNMIAATVAYQVRHMSLLKKMGVNLLLEYEKTKLFVTKTVKELLFDGYEDKLLNLVKNFTHVPFTRFGYFVERNNSATADGIFTMWTGKSNMRELGLMDQWNFKKNTGLYGYPCDVVQGSSGDLWPPVTGENKVHIFSSDLCFALQLSATGNIEAHGLPGRRFVGDNRTLDTGIHFPEARCQCVGECQPYGTLNASTCRFGSPLFVSFPHFYLADPMYLKPLEGLHPNEQHHSFSISLEPNTGMPLHVEAKLQLNVLVEPWPHLSMFRKVPQRMYMPMLWFVQRADLPPDLASLARTLLAIPAIGRGTFFGIAGIGAFILLVGLLVSWRHGWSASKTESSAPLLSSESCYENGISN